jgi:hypothetical protein
MTVGMTVGRSLHRFVAPYCWLAGFSDALTGLLLVAAPVRTLGWLFIPPPAAEPVYLRYVGVFVAAVGLSYLYPLLLRPGAARRRRLATVLEVTALQRSAVALFLFAAVAGGALPAPWLGVALFDGALATLQLTVLRPGETA